MRTRSGLVLAATVAFVSPGLARAGDAPPAPPAASPAPPPVATQIEWLESVAAAFQRAAKEGKPVFIAINAQRVDGGKLEPAGLELRENTYHDVSVVSKSRSFCCALVQQDGASADYTELRARFKIDGAIVSPQHVLAHADGSLIERKEYWSHRAGKDSVDALIAMMDKALEAVALKKAIDAGGGSPGGADAARAEWIAKVLDLVRRPKDEAQRDAAIAELVKGDQKGDCIEPLCTLMVELKKEPGTQVSILKAVGKPGLEFVLPPVASLLDAQDTSVRSAAAVTLEYVGCARAVEPLAKRLPKEKDERARNNLLRAMGRCGVGTEAVRKTLIREMQVARSDAAMDGPLIGLAYFEKDAEVARALEKQTKKAGAFQRGVVLWALTEVGDPKSADFVDKELWANEKNPLALVFLRSVMDLLRAREGGGDDLAAKAAVENGAGWMLSTSGVLSDPARQGRDAAGFKPKGELPVGRGPGRGGMPGGGPGGPPPGGMGN